MSMKMVVLGILMEGNSHPYEMQQFIKRREMEQYIKLQKGSLYYTVEQLEKNGFIEVESIIRDTNHPDKTVYKITEEGCKEFHDLILEQLNMPQDIFIPLHETIAFMKHLGKNELMNALKSKIKVMEHSLSCIKSCYKKHEFNIPKYGLYIMANAIEISNIEITILKKILADVENDSLANHEGIEGFSGV
jgi:DNA-binding PadR family transcriptional regulator